MGKGTQRRLGEALEASLAIGVDRMQRDFRPLKRQVEEWQALQLSTPSAKLLIYQAFIEDEFGFPKHLARLVHELYFQPVHEEFQPRTMWSLSNAFTSAFKELEPNCKNAWTLVARRWFPTIYLFRPFIASEAWRR